MGDLKLTVTGKKGVDINKGNIGLFFEDINYAADGGLYAEMIENRSFEFFKTTGVNDAYSNELDGLYGWYKYPENNPFTAMELRTDDPLSPVNRHYLHIRTRRERMGFTNKSYDGLVLKKNERYNVTLYMNVDRYDGIMSFRIEKDGDVLFFYDVDCSNEEKGWNEIAFCFEVPADVKNARLVVLLDRPGEADFDFISVMPASAVYGIFRKDLADMLKDLKPGFLRFPGGCVIEGNNLENRYQWKLSVGDVRDRKANWNRWAVHNNGR
ncbi:MAG: alpha-L-arabinofuranosidase, partial [Lachnospiraceae bacterium]|nr:alpha-L-arabinofuranosidase [Lachnospiraceae bacterium]